MDYAQIIFKHIVHQNYIFTCAEENTYTAKLTAALTWVWQDVAMWLKKVINCFQHVAMVFWVAARWSELKEPTRVYVHHEKV